MIIRPTAMKGSDGKSFTIKVKEFKGGLQTLLDESRLPLNAVSTSQNVIQDQDGVWRPRYGSQPYGQGLVGPIDGLSDTVVTYNSDGTNTNYLFVMDNGTVKYSKDGGAWTSCTGRTYTTGYQVQFIQVKSRVYVLNGKDSLSFVDLSTFTVTAFTALSTPTAPTGVKTGLAGTSFNIYYKITAVKNVVGETAASPESVVVQVGKARGLNGTTSNWTLGTDLVTLSWSAVSGADSYNIYISDRSSSTGVDFYLIDSAPSNSYVDDGSKLPSYGTVAPAFDGTAGPAASAGALSGNRLWLTGDPNYPYRVFATGTGAYMGSINPFFGGFWVDIEQGGAERPQSIVHYRDGKGSAVATVLTSNPMGGGSTWFITTTSVTVGNISVTVPQLTKQGSIGTGSPYGVVLANNNAYYPSIKGFQSLGSATSILNVLVTAEVSANVRKSVKGINNAYAKLIAGKYYYGKIFWTVPFASTTNSQIWVYDLERRDWYLPWTIGVKQFAEYADSTGTVRLLAVPVTGTGLIEFSQDFKGDSGVAFTTILESGLIHWDDNHMLWARLDKAYVELGRPKGTINFQVSGTQKNKPVSLIGSTSITDLLSNSGVGSDLVGDFLAGDSNSAPSTFASASTKKRIRIRKLLNNAKWSITSGDINQDWALLEVVLEGKVITTSDPTSWKN